METVNGLIEALGGGSVATLIAILLGTCAYLLKHVLSVQAARVQDQKDHTELIIEMFDSLLEKEE